MKKLCFVHFTQYRMGVNPSQELNQDKNFSLKCFLQLNFLLQLNVFPRIGFHTVMPTVKKKTFVCFTVNTTMQSLVRVRNFNRKQKFQLEFFISN